MPLIPAEASLVYRVTSRTARVAQRNPISKTEGNERETESERDRESQRETERERGRDRQTEI